MKTFAQLAATCLVLNLDYCIKSTPDGKGLGLFAKRFIPANSNITIYGGDVIYRRDTNDHVHSIKVPMSACGDDTLINGKCIIDNLVYDVEGGYYYSLEGHRPHIPGYACIANSATRNTANAHMVWHAVLDNNDKFCRFGIGAKIGGVLEATEDIEKDEEICWFYQMIMSDGTRCLPK